MEQYEDEIMEVAIYFLSILALPEVDVSDYLADIDSDGRLETGMEEYSDQGGNDSPCLPFKVFCWVPLYSTTILGFWDLPYFDSLSQQNQEMCETSVSRLRDCLNAIAWSGELLEYEVVYPSGDGFQEKIQTFMSMQIGEVDAQNLSDHNDVKQYLADSDFKPFSKQSLHYEKCWSRVREESRSILKALGFSPQLPAMTIQEITHQLMPG